LINTYTPLSFEAKTYLTNLYVESLIKQNEFVESYSHIQVKENAKVTHWIFLNDPILTIQCLSIHVG